MRISSDNDSQTIMDALNYAFHTGRISEDAAPSGMQGTCRECRKRLYPQTKEYQLAAHIKHRYKLTISEYLAMLAGGCEICGTMEGLCIDHDHRCCSNVGGPTCGKCIRGVLCHKHNRGEAAFISIEEIDALLVYRLKFEPTKGM